MDVPLYVATFTWVMNKKTYDDMSPAQKKVIDDHCTTEWAQRFASPWADFEHAGVDKMKAERRPRGLSADAGADSAAWRKAAEPLKAKWAEGAKKAGIDPDKAFADLTATLEKYKAGY